MIAMLTGQSIR